MPSRNATIAQAVTDALNAASAAAAFPAAFTAVRRWAPLTDTKDLGKLTVAVYPAGEARTRDTRAHDRYETVVDVGIVKRLSATARPDANDRASYAQYTAECDAHTEFAEAVCAFFKPGAVAIENGEFLSASILSPLIDPNVALNDRCLATLVTVTFQSIFKNL